MAETTPKNFRMSQSAILLLRRISENLGITETEVVEICVAKHAMQIEHDIDRARDLLFEHITGAVSKKQSDSFSVYISKDLMSPLDALASKLNTRRGLFQRGK